MSGLPPQRAEGDRVRTRIQKHSPVADAVHASTPVQESHGCLAGSDNRRVAPAPSPFPGAPTTGDPRHERARQQIDDAQAIAAAHQPDDNGFCRGEGGAVRWPCSRFQTAARRTEDFRRELVLTEVTQPLPTLSY